MRGVRVRRLVVDTSAVVAILQNEPCATSLLATLANAERRELSAANLVEAGTVLSSRRPQDPRRALRRLDEFLAAASVLTAPFDIEQARLALEARTRFGKGLGHPARLNMGDTFAYALAEARNAPLLYVGDDFSRTDVVPAL